MLTAIILKLEHVTGIGPACSAWEANILPLNHTCVALLYHKERKNLNKFRLMTIWWVLTGSNRRPSVRQTDALPAELNTQILVPTVGIEPTTY